MQPIKFVEQFAAEACWRAECTSPQFGLGISVISVSRVCVLYMQLITTHFVSIVEKRLATFGYPACAKAERTRNLELA